MTKLFFTITLFFAFSLSGFSQAEKIVGKWKTIDDKDGSEKSIVSIFKATNGEKLTAGTILDPKTGKVYKCNISLDSNTDNLIVRGSLDSRGWIGRSQTWIRLK